jgi:perosamine synthetase
MTDFQAALVNSQLKRLAEIISVKNRLASIYLSEIKHKGIVLPKIPVEAKHTWQTFHILLESNSIREKIAAYLKDHKIFTNYGAQCIPATQYYSEKYKHNPGKEFPNAFQAFKCGLAIPIYDRLAEKQVYRIARIINKFK